MVRLTIPCLSFALGKIRLRYMPDDFFPQMHPFPALAWLCQSSCAHVPLNVLILPAPLAQTSVHGPVLLLEIGVPQTLLLSSLFVRFNTPLFTTKLSQSS